jgi:Protein  of unknown function (DUF3018)
MELRDPEVRADIRRQVKIMASSGHDAIDDWIEAIYDWDEFGDPPPPS